MANNSYSGFSGTGISERERKQMLDAMYRSSGDADDAFKAEDITKTSGDIFGKGLDAMSNARVGETQNVFGFKVDAGIAGLFSSIYSNASHVIFNALSTKTYANALKIAEKAGVESGSIKQKRIAATATMGVAVALKAGKNISELWGGVQTSRKERRAMANRIAPILDEVKGRHSANALNAVREADNEVIYAHRDRMRRIARSTNANNLTGLALEALPNLFLDFNLFKGMWGGLNPTQASTEHAAKEAAAAANNQGMGVGQNLLGVVVNTSTGPMASRIKETNKHKLRMSLQPYSALEMILELEKQVESNPKSRTFQLPKSFHNPKSRPEECSLDEYLMRICIQHQKDMSAISEEHTEIREALKEDLAAAVKPMAKAIREGEMSTQSLIRLVGEGKIIKKHGRAIADAADVEAMLERNAPKLTKSVHVDPAEFYKDAPYSRAEFKAALAALAGEQKRQFAARVPDAILADAGMSSDEIKSLRATTDKMKDYERSLAEEVMGVAYGKTDEELKEKGLATSEAKRLHEAAKKIEHEGEKAAHELKTSPTNSHGVDQLLLNIAVPQLAKGDKEYFGKVIQEGHEKLEEISDGAEHERHPKGHHTMREHHRASEHKAAYNEME